MRVRTDGYPEERGGPDNNGPFKRDWIVDETAQYTIHDLLNQVLMALSAE